jgi:hypothetical protein
MADTVGPLVAIKKYFERADKFTDGQPGRPCAPTEITKLSPEERLEMGKMCAAELGLELKL